MTTRTKSNEALAQSFTDACDALRAKGNGFALWCGATADTDRTVDYASAVRQAAEIEAEARRLRICAYELLRHAKKADSR